MAPSLQALEELVQEARRAGARGVELLVTTSSGVTLTSRGRSHPDRKRHDHATLSVRCWLDGGSNAVAVGAVDAFPTLLAKALESAAAAPPDAFSGPIRRSALRPRGLGIDDQRHDQLLEEDRIDVVMSNLRAATKTNVRTRAGDFTYREDRTERRFVNSHGVSHQAAFTTYEASGEITILDDHPPVTLTDHIAGRAFASTACLPFGAMLAQRAERLATLAPPLDGPIRVLLPPRATGALIAWMAPMFTVQDLERSQTFIARATTEPLFHKRLHLVDDGALPGGLRTYGFDDRGVTPVPLNLLREGLVAARYLDPEWARRLDTRPTGHCTANGLQPTNLQLNGGARSMNAWLGEQDQLVFEVDDLPDLSGIDPITGDLELVVHGVVHDRHRLVGARRGVRLVGNLVEALQQVHGVASDTDRINHVDAPGMFLDGLSVHG